MSGIIQMLVDRGYSWKIMPVSIVNPELGYCATIYTTYGSEFIGCDDASTKNVVDPDLALSRAFFKCMKQNGDER